MSKLRNVPEIRAVVMRDPTEKISNTYPAYEIPVLVHLHGGRVDVVGPEFDKDGEPMTRTIDEGAEISRLIARHGEEQFTRVYGPAVPGCLERVIDGVLEMADDDSEVLTESEEHEQNMRAKARQRRLSQMAARRKGVIRPRRGQSIDDVDLDQDAPEEVDLDDMPAGQAVDADAAEGADEFAALDAAEEEYLESEGEESEVDGEEEAEEAAETAEQEAARKRSEAAKKAAATRAAKKAEAQG